MVDHWWFYLALLSLISYGNSLECGTYLQQKQISENAYDSNGVNDERYEINHRGTKRSRAREIQKCNFRNKLVLGVKLGQLHETVLLLNMFMGKKIC